MLMEEQRLRSQVAEWNRGFHRMGVERRVKRVVFDRVLGEVLEVVSEPCDYGGAFPVDCGVS